jgi:hypothetical protein
MGNIAKGTSKVVAYKRETTWGTLAGATAAKQLRRVTGNFNLTKETYESNEIRTDYQVADMRHGVRTAEGSLNGELSPKSYADFMESVLARNFTAVTSITGLTLTIAASGSSWTVTRSTGSFLTDGVKVGQVVRLTGASLNADNVGKNLLVSAVTALAITVSVVNGTAMFAQSTIASCTLATVGKYTFAPLTGHTDDSYTIEEFYSDIAQSEVYTGMKVGSMNVQLPATGLVTADFSFMGKDLTQTGTTQYFTTPTVQGTDGIFAAVNGLVLVNGTAVGVVTSADFTVERAMENATVVGSNSVADIFTGRIRVNGNFSTYFTDGTFRGYFANEDVVSLVFLVTTNNTAAADFIAFTLPKVKINSATKDDTETGIVQAHSFVALLNDVTTGGLAQTTIAIQDSAA